MKQGDLVFILKEEGEVCDVLRSDLVEMGIVPRDVLEADDDGLWKRIMEGKGVKRVRILKQGKLVDGEGAVKTEFIDFAE